MSETGTSAGCVGHGLDHADGSWSRRDLLALIGAVAIGGARPTARGDDLVSDAELEGLSFGRTVRVGSPSTGAVSVLPLEVYVARVLAAEADPRAPDAAREALAVAVRTYALANEGRHERDGHDVCDTTHCQVVRQSSDATRRLTQATAMQVLTIDGRPATLFYSASCGGVSERASDVWPGTNYSYLQSRPDPVHEDEAMWTWDVALVDVETTLRDLGFEGHLTGLEVASTTESGRAATLRLTGMTPSTIDAYQFRLAIGATRVRSTAFTVSNDGESVRFVGRGYGHGVGMCVVGAGHRALRGARREDILAHYYPGLELMRLPPPRGTSRVPTPYPFPRPR